MKIIIATGGSGGHIFPALRVAQQLRNEKHSVVFMGVFGQRRKEIEEDYDVHELAAEGFVFSSVRGFVKSSIAMIKAIARAMSLLRFYKPDAVAGFGSYASFPVVLAAFFLRIPTLIHEQNVVPGKANRFLSYFVSKIAISFDQTRTYFNKRKTVVTGCPCHKKLEHQKRLELLTKFHLDEGQPIILVLGGSQGSKSINDIFLKTAVVLKEKIDFQVIHLTGPRDNLFIAQMYKKLGIKACIREFLFEMEEAYALADLAVSRAGAVTVVELAMCELPSILIPYPHADNHQRENARVLCEAKLAQIIEEKDLTHIKLAMNISNALKQHVVPNRLSSDQSALWFTDADKRLAKEVVTLK